MSEDNAPKLRLKPKLAADLAIAPQQPAAPGAPGSELAAAAPSAPEPAATAPAEAPGVRLKPRLSNPPVQAAAVAPATNPPVAPTPVPAPSVSAPAEAPGVRLKPRLSAPPMQTTAAKPVTTPPMPPPAAAAPPAAAPPAPPPPAAEKPKFGLRPKAAAAPGAPVPPPAAPVPVVAQALPDDVPEHPSGMPSGEPPLLGVPVETDTGAGGEPGEITAMRKASGAPFPPPPGSFPAPPGVGKNMAEGEKAAKGRKPAGKSGSGKNLIKIAGGAIAAVVVLGGGYFAYLKFKTPPPPPPRPKAVAKPKPPAPPVVEKAPEPVVEKPKVEPVVVAPAPVTPVVTAPPPPPPASEAFKAWVENLRIMGVRTGREVRIFVGGTAYAPGDLVNPQLGITFAGYNAETRMLLFKDASGAKVERRN